MLQFIQNIPSDLDEAVFETRNKVYGGYQLRKSYNRYILTGLAIACALLFLFCLCSVVYLKNAEAPEVYEYVDYRSENFSLEDVKLPSVELERPAPKNKTASSETAPPVVTDEKEEEKPKDQEKQEKTASPEDGKGKSETATDTKTENVATVSSDTSGSKLYSSEIFMKVEIPAEFPGGNFAFGKFLGEHIKYSDYARENKVDGIVYIHMIVNNDGSLTDMKIYKGIEESCNQEVLRVMKLSPKWVPARQKGLFVRQRIIVPIRFKVP